MWSDAQLQLSHMTRENRFPKMMESAKQMKPDARRILSFGCSTGEEVFSLASTFPDAEIVGVDLDYYSISRARKQNKENRVYFHTEVGATGKYDLVTCFMVLFSLEKPIEFDKWHEVVKIIDKTVAPNGVLMIYTSDHDFAHSSVFNNYEIIKSWKREHNKNQKEYFCGYYRKTSKILEEFKELVLLAG